MKPSSLISCFVVLLLSLSSAFAATPGPVNVILWFDTEDYLLPADDDACKRLAEMLTARGVRATFKVVGEKARVLEQRRRTDVIAALKQHDIAYHANFHSVHPTPSEYLADCGLLDGIAEFVRREGRGADDVRRIFGVSTLSCYGQPGSSWGSQAIAALPQIGVAPQGVPCYVDEGDHVGLNEQPFWYAGALVVYHMGQNWTRMELHDPDAVGPAKEKAAAIARRLAQNGGGLISIFYHPCEWVHREFWDGVNFRRGANPPREQWRPPPQRSAAETDAAFQRFGQYIDSIRLLPGVRFVTASELPSLYADKTVQAGATEQDLNMLAGRLVAAGSGGVNFQVCGDRAYSLADQFQLLALACDAKAEKRNMATPVKLGRLLGPDGAPPASSPVAEVRWPAFKTAIRDVVDFMQREERIPARVFIGPDAVAPADFLVGMASVCLRESASITDSSVVALGHGVRVLAEEHIAKDTPDLFGGWVIHKEGFRALKILEVARWQSWTLKPAVARERR